MEQDPRKAAEEYMEKHKVPQLLEALTSSLLFHRPDDSKAHICKYLENVKSVGTPALLTEVDFETMFSMFDITNRGSVTSEQANNALRSILGPSGSLEDVGIKSTSILTKDMFVKSMTDAIHKALAYKLEIPQF
eukprot:gene30429-35437_t